jgi:plastocyanin
VVTQKEKTFLPATIEIRVGQALEIVNEDTTLHNAYCSAGDFKYNSGPQQPGSKSTLTFTAPGAYEVRCAIHPKMRLAVTVAP